MCSHVCIFVCVYVCITMHVFVYVCMSVFCMCVRFVCVYMYVFTVSVFMYLCKCVRVYMYIYAYGCVCICRCAVCMYVRMYMCIVMFPSLNVTMDVQPRYFKYYWHHRPVQGCGSSNCWRVKLFRFFNLGREISTEKIGYKTFAIYLFFWAYASTFFYHYRN